MTLEPILRRQFSNPDRSAVQEAVASAVERNPERFIERYLSLEQSLGGRYVSADLFKETFEQYGASKDSRNRYNAPVHNAAAVLASANLRRLVSAPDQHGRDTVILLTRNTWRRQNFEYIGQWRVAGDGLCGLRRPTIESRDGVR